jgi:hypothetical protein
MMHARLSLVSGYDAEVGYPRKLAHCSGITAGEYLAMPAIVPTKKRKHIRVIGQPETLAAPGHQLAKKTAWQERAIALIADCPGMTTAEIAAVFRIGSEMVYERLQVLRDRGLIKHGRAMRISGSARSCTWEIDA